VINFININDYFDKMSRKLIFTIFITLVLFFLSRINTYSQTAYPTYVYFPTARPVTLTPRPTLPVTCASGAISTAIGCIPVNDLNAFTAFVLRWAIGIAGGIAFILIVIASFQVITSSGNPQKIQAGKELLTAAIGGLIFLIFSIFILELVGVRILRLPGF